MSATIPPIEYPDRVGAHPTNPFLAIFQPFIPPGRRVAEFTPAPIIVGTLLGMIFGASSLYLVLKVGLTVSASIPVAVLSITFFRLVSKLKLRRDATILENNITQTAGSAGESIAFGVGVTMPAIMILGFDLELTRVMLVAILGGLLGILMMIPLRRALIVEQHGLLKYPEGTACAEVLKAAAAKDPEGGETAGADRGESVGGGRIVFSGFGLGLLYQSAMGAFRAWKSAPEKVFGPPFTAGSVGIEVSPALLGVGYIIGPRIASIMCAGGVLAYLVLIPAIKFFGERAVGVVPPGTIPIAQMGPDDIRGAYVLYIGAGAVAAGGIISLFRSLPTIWRGLVGGLRDLRGSHEVEAVTPRTDRDLSMKVVIIGCLGLIAVIMAMPQLGLQWNIVGATLIVLFGFLFVTVSSRLTGEIGSSSNPISGMTVATLLLTCLVFLFIGWTGPNYFITALSIGGIVCIAASNGGTTSQDLKTGFLVGATPRLQQIAILIGALTSALILGPILLKLNDASTVYVPIAQVGETIPADLRAPADQLGRATTLQGPQGLTDRNTYRTWNYAPVSSASAQQFLVNEEGRPVYLVDPGINGVYRTRPDGSTVEKFDAPKATLMSYIIKGVLSRDLPWNLILLGVMIAVILEMSGLPSLAFAVGVYLPLSASTPILAGGIMRALVDRYLRLQKFRGKKLSEEQLIAEGDKSPGVLLASGYIAGGALAGIIIAFMDGAPTMANFSRRVTEWQTANNPFYAGPNSDWLALIPFLALAGILYLVGRDKLLAPRPR